MEDQGKNFQETVDKHILKNIRDTGKATLRDIMKSIILEVPDFRTEIKANIPEIRKRIEEISKLSDEERNELFDLEDLDSSEMNEYQELEEALRDQFKNNDIIKKNLLYLGVYGSCGQHTRIIGQSDINFLLLLKNIPEKEEEGLFTEINNSIEAIMNPLFVHLFDLTVLWERDLENLSKIGTAFTHIHAFSTAKGKELHGENPFKQQVTKEQIDNASRSLIMSTIYDFEDGKDEIEETKGKTVKEDLAYLSSEAIVNLALSLCFLQDSEINNLTKPIINEKFKELFETHKIFKKFIKTVDTAYAYRIGVMKKSEEEIFSAGKKMIDVLKKEFIGIEE